MSSQARCRACGAPFRLPPGAPPRGRVRCHACGRVLAYTVLAPGSDPRPTEVYVPPLPTAPVAQIVPDPAIPVAKVAHAETAPGYDSPGVVVLKGCITLVFVLLVLKLLIFGLVAVLAVLAGSGHR